MEQFIRSSQQPGGRGKQAEYLQYRKAACLLYLCAVLVLGLRALLRLRNGCRRARAAARFADLCLYSALGRG